MRLFLAALPPGEVKQGQRVNSAPCSAADPQRPGAAWGSATAWPLPVCPDSESFVTMRHGAIRAVRRSANTEQFLGVLGDV